MTKLQNKFETFLAGLLYVAIGTTLAAQVDAQSPTKAAAAATSPRATTASPGSANAPVAGRATSAPKAAAADCEDKTSPDAVCSIAPAPAMGATGAAGAAAPARPEFKVCFSSRHPRCFELQKTKLVQSLNGMPAHDTTVDAKQAEHVTKAVKDYRSWLESKKATAPTSLCRNVVTVDLDSDHKELCVSGLPKKEMQEKNKALIELLEAPPKAPLKSSK